jgi:hypothetical protein
VIRSTESIEDLAHDAAFWDHRSRGLAIFHSDEMFQRFRIGWPVEEQAIVNRRFHVKQLLPSVSAGEAFWILAVSQNRVRFLNATPYACEAVLVEGLPQNLESALNFVPADRGQQVHSAMHGALGKQAAVFHGHGGRRESSKADIAQYFRQIDEALRPMLQASQCPLILAGVAFESSIFRKNCKYENIAAESLVGNFDYLSDHEVHAQAVPLAQRIFGQKRSAAAARYRELANTPRASERLDAILPAACRGEVETLFVDCRAVELGRYNPTTEFISYGVGGKTDVEVEDLIDRTAAECLLRRADVFAVPRPAMPCNSPVAAIYRY